ncbi:Phosphatase 2C family protein [Quillaja saponaria]|uniref:Phosphatase 2C family protein n=1 Tax=Quillaja saponaria TaxID=32244 RepID=A0AAD7QDY3_QUISA|nr:Phosphatase 2C family protein [Quillaja saponaria]KAJ7979111.1 Phosphatase 2C family protein [Quillaja saponaria]
MTDPVVDFKGSDCSANLECFLNIVRALGMGSCLSGDGTSARTIPYSPTSTSDMGKRRNSMKKLRRNSSFESSMELRPNRIPGRFFLNGSTQVASLFCKQGKKGFNQDAMIVWENFCSKEDTIFCGVFDGHGPFGHKVAKKVRDALPLKLIAQWELHQSSKMGISDGSSSTMGNLKSGEIAFRMIDEEHNDVDNVHKDDHTNIFMTLKESFLKACKVMDKELKLHPDIDCYCSGTTAVTMVKQGQDLVIGNVGDSRAVLGTRDIDGTLTAVQLTIDQKPNLPREAARIKLRKGRVFALQHEPEVSRVWLPNTNSPGLAMARAFGDFCLKDFGLISVPDVSLHRLSEKDEFVVLATDGVWDVLTNREVVDIVAAAPQSSSAQTLVESAVRAWRMKFPTSKVDDCAVICLFLDTSANYTSAYSVDNEKTDTSLMNQLDDISRNTAPESVEKDHLGIPKPPSECLPLLGENGIERQKERHQL